MKITSLICYLVLACILSTTGYAYSQDLVVAGVHTKTNYQSESQLTSKPLKLEKTARIVKIAGDNNGFWIQEGTQIVKKFSKSNDPSGIGYVIKPGVYTVYPILNSVQNKADITLTFKYTE